MRSATVALFVIIVIGVAIFSENVGAEAYTCMGAAPEAADAGYNYETEQDNWFHYEQGLRMVAIGDWDQAMKEFNYYIRQPKMHRGAWGAAYLGLGIMHQKRGDLDTAVECFQQAVKRDRHPRVSVGDKAYMNIGAIYLKKKDYSKAIDNYKKAVEKDPKSGLAHYYLGMSHLKSGDLENAEKERVESKKLGVTYTALAEGIAEARNPSATKSSEDGEQPAKAKHKKRKATK